jgi:hypothetical protein
MTMNDPNRPVSQRRASSNFGWITTGLFAVFVLIAGIAWVTWGGNDTKIAANPPAPQSETTGSGVAIPLPATKAPVNPSKTAPTAPVAK